MSEADEQIRRIRTDIDGLDEQIVALLDERARYVLEMRQVKDEAALDIYDPAREQEIYEKLAALNNGPLADEDLRRIYSTLLEVMKTFG